MATCLLIFQKCEHELSYDHSYQHAGYIKVGGQLFTQNGKLIVGTARSPFRRFSPFQKDFLGIAFLLCFRTFPTTNRATLNMVGN